MLPKWHLFLGFFFALTLFLVFPEIEIAGFLIIFFSTFLMDIDHYIYYVFKKRDFSGTIGQAIKNSGYEFATLISQGLYLGRLIIWSKK